MTDRRDTNELTPMLAGPQHSAPLRVPPGAAQVPPAQVPGLAGLLGLAIGVVVIAGLYFAKDVLMPVVLAILLSFVLSPIVSALRRAKFPKGLAILVSVLVALGILGGIGTVVGTQAASLTSDAPKYAQTIEGKIGDVRGYLEDKAKFFTRANAGVAPKVKPGTPAPALGGAAPTGAQPRAPVPVQVTNNERSEFSIFTGVLAPILAPFETFVIVLVVAIFILMQKEDLRDRVIRVFGSADLHRTTLAMDDAGARLSRYFLSQLAVNTTFGVVIGTGLWLIGMPVPALWGILAGILRFVPYVGALLGAVLPLAIAAGVDPGWTMPIEVVALFAVVEPLTGYVVEPLLYGHSTGLSPLSVILAAVFWTWIWGPVGLVLSMPLTLCLTTLGRHVPSLEFIDVLLGDRPALTPVEGFYQRMLADDPEEALEQADQYLADHSLTDYYDQVALEGLRLAALDARRGAFDRAQAGEMVDAVRTLVDALEVRDDQDDIAAQDWGAAGAVVCIAGRGVIDEGATAMLAQLLRHKGFATEELGHQSTQREAIDTLRLDAARLVCLSFLDIGGSPSYVRALVRRLKRRYPDTPVMIGIWPEGEAALTDPEVQAGLGADHYVGSLRRAVEVAVELADGPGQAA